MRIFVKVKPGSKISKIEKIDESHFSAFVKAPPVEGKANDELISLIADYFKVPKSRVKIASGFTSKNKVVEIG